MPKPWENYQERPSPQPEGQPASPEPEHPRPQGQQSSERSAASGPPEDPFFGPFSPEPVAPPACTNLPPAPVTAGTPERPAREVSASVRVSPVTVFTGSYLFAGIAAVLLALAIASLVALPDFRRQHDGASAHVAQVIVATALVVVAAAVLWLGVLDDRGRRSARIWTWVVCGLLACAAAAVLVSKPGSSVGWFAHVVQFGAGAVVVASALSALLLALPESNAYFRVARVDRPAASQPPASDIPVSAMPASQPDFDPFA